MLVHKLTMMTYLIESLVVQELQFQCQIELSH